MKATHREKLICILFCGFLGVMSLMYLILPKKDFSETEKRYLADPPSLSWSSLTSGRFGKDMETYMADRMPGRDFFVGLNAYGDLLTGRQVAADIYLARGGRLVEAPVTPDEASIEKNMAAIGGFSAGLDIPTDLMLIPSAGWAAREQILGPAREYRDPEIIRHIYEKAPDPVNCLDCTARLNTFPDPASLYYRTDHHWTSEGAYQAYRFYMESIGAHPVEQEVFTVETHEGFRGSTYSRSALWLTEGEPISLWSGDPITVTNDQDSLPHEGPFYPERLRESDMYTVFLDGNHGLVRLRNPRGKGKLLVIRDSYTNCLGPFLAQSFEEVVLADLRYYKEPLSQLTAREGFDRVLVLYSLSNFLSDRNIIFLK